VNTIGLLAIALAVGGPSLPPDLHPTAAAGIAAYERGDFDTAFATLKPFVFDLPPNLNVNSPPEPFATLYLARMIFRGEGTVVDPSLACVLYHFATFGLIEQVGRSHDATLAAIDESKSACNPGLGIERLEMNGLLACPFREGVGRTVISLSTGGTLVVDRGGIHITRDGRTTTTRELCGKYEVTVSVSGTHLRTVTDFGPRLRDFVERFVWISSSTNGHIRRELQWQIYEVIERRVVLRLAQPMLFAWDTPYPSPQIPDNIRSAAVLRLNDAGAIEFTVNGLGSGVIR
jgi:hypothetical protein